MMFQMGDDSCAQAPSIGELPGLGLLTECVGLDSCPGVLDNPRAPENQTLICGFDEQKSLLKICCPKNLGTKYEHNIQIKICHNLKIMGIKSKNNS